MAKVMGTFVEVGNPMAFGGKPFEVTVSLPKVVFSKNVKVLGLIANYPKAFDRSFRLLKRHKELPFGRLNTHPFHKLEDLKPTMDKMGDVIKESRKLSTRGLLFRRIHKSYNP